MTPKEKKEAKRLYDKQYRKNNKKKLAKQKKDWVTNNPDKVIDCRLRNKSGKKISDKKYANKNVIKLNKKKTDWAKANPAKKTKANSDYVKKKILTDPLYKLKHYTIISISNSFKCNGFSKKSRTHQILGCSFEELKQYLESKFLPWMNWSNKGNWNGIPKEPNVAWDIDHIIPISTAKTEEDIIRLNHYTNLQPLCSYINRWIKSDQF